MTALKAYLNSRKVQKVLSKRPGEPITIQFECDKLETKYKF